MKIKFFKPLSIILIMALGLMMTFSACESDPVPMDLPPAESLVIDLSQLPTNNTKSADAFVVNWLYSSLSVLGWNVAIAVNMAVPVAAYAEAFNHVPVYMDNDSWEWSYSVPVAGQTYDVSLVGTQLDKKTFAMVMTLSQVGGFQDFTWFEGEIMYDHTQAEWTIYHSPLDPTEYLNVFFQQDLNTDVASIKYTVTDPDNELYNAYIEYGNDPTYEMDAYYTIFKSDNTTYVEWNTTTYAGHVKDLAYFKDDEWHCWDTQLQDVDCAVE
ncbi:MAG: hypothetical protein PF450_04825 [Bacteroidales bacterium]|jgi:hypothetical protein|nr:hypothetical protein [Bacteroidales bacterium]